VGLDDSGAAASLVPSGLLAGHLRPAAHSYRVALSVPGRTDIRISAQLDASSAARELERVTRRLASGRNVQARLEG